MRVDLGILALPQPHLRPAEGVLLGRLGTHVPAAPALAPHASQIEVHARIQFDMPKP